MTDEELAAEARRVAPQLRALHAVIVDQHAAELLRQLADRLDDRGRCPPCGGDPPGEEE